MNWVAQTGHVAAKDVRHTRLQLAAYVAILVTTAASVMAGRALGPYSPTSSTQVLGAMDVFVVYLPMCTVLLGFIVAASLLQADSPTRATAFWASRPLSPSAVLASKLALVCITIVALPLLAALVALRSFDASAAVTASVLGHAARIYGEWLMAAMIVGALTDDLRAFVGAIVAILIATIIVLGGLSDSVPASVSLHDSAAVIVLDVIQLAALAGGIGLLAYLYRTHQRGRSAWIAGSVIVACLMCCSVASPSEARSTTRREAAGPLLTITPASAATSGQPHTVMVEVEVPGHSDSMRHEFRPDTMHIDTKPGKSIDRPAGLIPHIIVDNALPPVGTSVRWLFDESSSGTHGRVTYRLDDAEETAVAGGIRSIAVDGVVTTYQPRVVASLPLREGAVATSEGRRIHIYGFSHGRSSAEVYVQVAGVEDESSGQENGLPGATTLQFALVNSARSEAMLIDRVQSSGVSGPAWVVLPWIGVSNSFTRYVTNASGHEALLPQDDAWYAGARLVIVEWVAADRYRTNGRMVLP